MPAGRAFIEGAYLGLDLTRSMEERYERQRLILQEREHERISARVAQEREEVIRQLQEPVARLRMEFETLAAEGSLNDEQRKLMMSRIVVGMIDAADRQAIYDNTLLGKYPNVPGVVSMVSQAQERRMHSLSVVADYGSQVQSELNANLRAEMQAGVERERIGEMRAGRMAEEERAGREWPTRQRHMEAEAERYERQTEALESGRDPEAARMARQDAAEIAANPSAFDAYKKQLELRGEIPRGAQVDDYTARKQLEYDLFQEYKEGTIRKPEISVAPGTRTEAERPSAESEFERGRALRRRVGSAIEALPRFTGAIPPDAPRGEFSEFYRGLMTDPESQEDLARKRSGAGGAR